MPASREKNGSPIYSPVADTRLEISSDTSRPSSGPLQPRTLGFKPFATPGPAHLLSSPVVTRDPRCPRPPPARLPPKPLYSNELERDPRPPYTLPPSPAVAPPQRNAAPCDVPEFRWERFDRSNPQLALSSSPVRVAAESEETFWSQPAQAILDASSPRSRHDASPAFSPHTPPRDTLPYSPAHNLLRHPEQLRDAVPQASPTDLPKTPVSQDHAPDEEDPDGSQEGSGGDGLFAWIVAPRDQPAPSTPRRRLADPRTELGPTPTTPMSGPAQGSSGRGRVVSSPDAIREGSPPTPPCGPSFAPAPGIYISPLRGEDEDTPVPIETNPRSSDLRPNPDAVKTENASPAKRSLADAAQLPVIPRRAGEDPERREDEEQACEGRENSSIYRGVEDAATHNSPQRLTSDIEEVDELEGASQVSRDSIEDWSD
ncbi:uncharacterized protein TRAVEDRAFT_43790 [Trametes versicolor FP-101664 SS1]|uniref:uncharacterized protein n=1 Tax=Trametes versicolor (strain FP-101664) TaxID=717944 RepID=UPI00046242D6|nr:uncharacterized protein TRAVEDRAFT_43790 [Trametes versicolor FP-101664 SS1]EIW63499.1 hypothetical protein TRAVEDRAFT_43790 [Trametes versicolor FP-101664 SS1]